MTAIVPQAPVSDLERMARAFAASGLFGVKNLDQALALMLVAQAEGRHPATAAQDYSIIQGRPSKKADAMLRDFLASGGRVEWHELSDDKADATFSHPAGGSARIDWTLDRAKKAQLSGNAMYAKYPRQMLRSRTVSEGVRTVCPGATSGMYVPEEVQDIVAEAVNDAPGQAALPPPAPARKSSAQAKRDGDSERIKDEIAKLDLEGVAEWFETFDERTANLPFGWLDPIRDQLEHRREDLMFAASDDGREAAEMDAAFAQTVAA
jgi:hypothetical protein